ncbi:MAG: ribosome maturation factor RimM [Thermoanaerobaculia bacterium]
MRSKSSTTDRPGSPPAGASPAGTPERVLVGTVLRPHGIRGEVTVSLWSDNERRFERGAEFSAVPLAGRTGSSPAERRLRVENATAHKGGLRVSFAGVADREAAETLRGLDLWVPLSEVPAAPAGAYYFFELIGCRCFDERDGDLGVVIDLHEDGGGVLLEVESENRRIVVPFVEAFLVNVDRSARRIDLRLPEGLVAACASRS